jgi:hypothetical protein
VGPIAVALLHAHPGVVVSLLCLVAAVGWLTAAISVIRGSIFWARRRHYATATSAFVSAVAQLRTAPSLYENPDKGVVVMRNRPRW